AQQFKILKVKLGLNTDKMMINTIRSMTDVPLCADVNQGWKNKAQVLDMAQWLSEQNVVFLEPPMPNEQIDDMALLIGRYPMSTMVGKIKNRHWRCRSGYRSKL